MTAWQVSHAFWSLTLPWDLPRCTDRWRRVMPCAIEEQKVPGRIFFWWKRVATFGFQGGLSHPKGDKVCALSFCELQVGSIMPCDSRATHHRMSCKNMSGRHTRKASPWCNVAPRTASLSNCAETAIWLGQRLVKRKPSVREGRRLYCPARMSPRLHMRNLEILHRGAK